MSKTLDRDAVRSISADVMDALKAVATKHGIQFSSKGARFTSSNVTFRLEAALLGAGGVAETRERTDYLRCAGLYGLKTEWLDKSFRHGGDDFTIIGLSTRKTKNPILCTNTRNGKTYIFPADTVKVLMSAQTKTPTTA
jgi:hypothetical protein